MSSKVEDFNEKTITAYAWLLSVPWALNDSLEKQASAWILRDLFFLVGSSRRIGALSNAQAAKTQPIVNGEPDLGYGLVCDSTGKLIALELEHAQEDPSRLDW
ncbi:hypothetical protein [Pseudomonas chlororaphis]|uniref:hypothetical protein n=1 Tax=Pseudomonas chlororaphis TaxID=587753 RepID=UPI002365D3A7|nr:hypothetical protein [Pseudomonas chlororaphis]WDH25398.1 hypothetical protein PUP50_14345 [Pseudomonas chlororaphis]